MVLLLAFVLLAIAVWLAFQIRTRMITVSLTGPPGSAAGEDLPELCASENSGAHPVTNTITEVFSEVSDAAAEILMRQVTVAAKAHPGGAIDVFKTAAKKKRPTKRKYDGEIRLPRRVYEKSSKTVSVTIARGLLVNAARGERLTITGDDGQRHFTLTIPEAVSAIEFELRAPEPIKVTGEVKQRQSVSAQKLTYSWNCYFSQEGEYELTLIVKPFAGGRKMWEEPVTCSVRVVKKFGLPKQVIAFISGALGLAGAVITVVDGGHKLNWW